MEGDEKEVQKFPCELQFRLEGNGTTIRQQRLIKTTISEASKLGIFANGVYPDKTLVLISFGM